MNIWSHLFFGQFGIEKETVRTNFDGHLARSPHKFAIDPFNPYITRDFGEAQLELITPPLPTIQDALTRLSNIERVALRAFNPEVFWPMSMPPILPQDEDIHVSECEANPEDKVYREYLASRYGKRNAIISGIHFNISISDTFIQKKHMGENVDISLIDYKDALYLKTMKYFMKERFIFPILFGASPSFDASYLLNETDDTPYLSYRSSSNGYRNAVEFPLDYSSPQTYHQSLNQAIDRKLLKRTSEYYAPAKVKSIDGTHFDYIELRFADLNPLSEQGVFEEDLQLMHLFTLYYMNQPDFEFTEAMQNEALESVSEAAISAHGSPLFEKAIHRLDAMSAFFNEVSNHTLAPYDITTIIDKARTRLEHPELLYGNIIRELVDRFGYIPYGLAVANKHKAAFDASRYEWDGAPALELSTKLLLQKVIEMGFDFEILDEKESFISITDPKTQQKEYVKQATKTRLDAYVNVLVMENKHITKEVLNEHDIQTPEGFSVTSKQMAQQLFDMQALPHNLVVKPNNTNFGIGISMLLDGYREDEFHQAINLAFQFDDTVLLETFAPGLEYRFLVIGDTVEAVIHRKAANVTGDGVSTIDALIEAKNTHPYRGTGYKTPLELIKVDDVVIAFLKRQGLTTTSVLDKGQTIYLRENSNISTGGDSVDVTAQVHENYKQIALKAARALGVHITGIDIMISDITREDAYSIIECNFNPAIHMHVYPLVGMSQDIPKAILNTLFKEHKPQEAEKMIEAPDLSQQKLLIEAFQNQTSNAVIFIIAGSVFMKEVLLNQAPFTKPTVLLSLMILSIQTTLKIAIQYFQDKKLWKLALTILGMIFLAICTTLLFQS